MPVNGVPRTSVKPTPPTTQSKPVSIAPTNAILKEKTESKPLQEQLPITQIKSEPVEYECKPVMAAPSAGTNGVVNGGTPTVAPGTALPQGVTMVLPTVGLMSPIGINLNDLQNVLKVAMDGNILKQVLGTANGAVTQGKHGILVQQPHQQIISLPAFVDHDGTTKIIINYSIGPTSATTATAQTASFIIKNNPSTLTVTTPAAPTPSKTDEHPTSQEETIPSDLTVVKEEPESVAVTTTESESATRPGKETAMTADAEAAELPKANSTSTCLLCDDCPDNLEALHLLQHRKAANGEAVDCAALDPSFAALLSEAGVTLEEPPMDDLLTLLKTYFASNANPSKEELKNISKEVSIPVDVVRKWFAKMNSGKSRRRDGLARCTNSSQEVASKKDNATIPQAAKTSTNPSPESVRTSLSPSNPSPNVTTGDLVIVKAEPEEREIQNNQAEPLDLSLPKQNATESDTPPPAKQQEQPLNLTCLRKEQFAGRTIYVTAPQTGKPVNIVTGGQLPTLVAITSQGTVGCLSALTTTKRTILIPQLTYTYTTTASSATGAKTVVLNGHKVSRAQQRFLT